jgi:hemerythrin-like metal-binding protein
VTTFVWKDEYSVNHELIDTQHQELVNRLNGFLDAMRQGKGTAEIENVLAFLGRYVVDHFGTEETVMRKYSYPGYTAHKREHEELIADFTEISADVGKNGVRSVQVIQAQEVLVDWLKNHILRMDKALGAFLGGRA